MDTPTQYIAQFSWGMLRAPADDPSVAPFFEGISGVHARADANPGFVWRSDGERLEGEAAGWPLYNNNRVITSFSVWKTPEALKDFIYNGAHGAFYSRRSDWFDQDAPRGYILWWVTPGEEQTIKDAWAMFDKFAAEGPSDEVFTFAELA